MGCHEHAQTRLVLAHEMLSVLPLDYARNVKQWTLILKFMKHYLVTVKTVCLDDTFHLSY